MKLLIKNSTLVNPQKLEEKDILIKDGFILRIARGIKERVDCQIEAKGKFVFPGLIDLHTHLRTPGREDEETLLTGCQAAVKGGFTKIFCMPNTEPALDNEGLIRWIKDESKEIGLADIYPVGAITRNREGKTLTDFTALKKEGCLALSDDGRSIESSLILRRAFEYAKMNNLLIISHCEDKKLSHQGVMRESFVSSEYGLAGVPYLSESLIVERDIQLASYIQARLHLAHLSTQAGVEILRRQKPKGAISAETCPHYFILTVEDIKKRNFDSNLKVNPPLGERKDVEAIREALAEGVIDCISSDHAPHTKAEKELPFEDAPWGIMGLELTFPLTYTYLVKEKIIDLKDLTKKLSFNPANLAGLKGCGQIKEGFSADLIIADLNKSFKVKEENLVSLSKNTPFLGYELYGVIEYTLKQGRIVYEAHRH